LSLITVGLLAASGPTLAQEPYPDLKGDWIGNWDGIVRGKVEHPPETSGPEPVFRELSWTVAIDRQEGNRFTGSYGRTQGDERRDPILGVIRADRKTIHMVDDDGTFSAILTGPDTMEVCRTEVTAVSGNVACGESTRQR
jgi:hypothetical protein